LAGSVFGSTFGGVILGVIFGGSFFGSTGGGSGCGCGATGVSFRVLATSALRFSFRSWRSAAKVEPASIRIPSRYKPKGRFVSSQLFATKKRV